MAGISKVLTKKPIKATMIKTPKSQKENFSNFQRSQMTKRPINKLMLLPSFLNVESIIAFL